MGLTQIVNSGSPAAAGGRAMTPVGHHHRSRRPIGNIAPTSIANSGVIRSNDAATDALRHRRERT